MVVKKLLLIGFIFLVNWGYSQSEFTKKEILRATATFGIGTNLGEQKQTLFIPTSLEYYFDEHISLRSDAVWFLGYSEELYKGFTKNHSIFTGISYHFTEKKQFDPYIGLQAGMALSQYGIFDILLAPDYIVPNDEEIWLNNNNLHTSATLNSLISPHLGINYYAKNYFHLFLAVRYIYGNHHSEIPVKSLEELRFEFGLGFNFQLKKAKSE